MNSPLLLPLLLLLAVSPLAAARPAYTECTSDTTYAANSSYEANLRRLAALLPASETPYAYRAVGLWPNRVAASSLCRRRRRDDGNGSSEHGRYSSPCGACIAGAFRELENACPRHKEAFFSDRDCALQVNEVRMFGTAGIVYAHVSGGSYAYILHQSLYILDQSLVSGFILQAIGFSWLFFLLLQEWRGRKKSAAVLPTSTELPPSG